MVMKVKSKIRDHPKAKTLYLTIPSELASNSNFPFEPNDRVFLEIIGDTLLIKKCE